MKQWLVAPLLVWLLESKNWLWENLESLLWKPLVFYLWDEIWEKKIKLPKCKVINSRNQKPNYSIRISHKFEYIQYIADPDYSSYWKR